MEGILRITSRVTVGQELIVLIALAEAVIEFYLANLALPHPTYSAIDPTTLK